NVRRAWQRYAFGWVLSGHECLDHLQTLRGAGLALTFTGLNDLAQFFCFAFQVKGLQTTLNRFSTHRAFEVFAVFVTHGAEDLLFTFEVTDLEVLEALPTFFHLSDFSFGALANLSHGLLGQGLGFFTFSGFRP